MAATQPTRSQRIGKRERLVRVARAPGLPFDQSKFELVVENIDA